jgi:hypothetical protein
MFTGIHVHRDPCSKESMFKGVISNTAASRVIPRSVSDEGSAVENTDGRMA